MADNNQTLFRKKAMNRISSPEDLTGYLRVTSPGMWIILAAVIVLLAGLFAWSAVGTLETTVDATAIVRDHTAQHYGFEVKAMRMTPESLQKKRAVPLHPPLEHEPLCGVGRLPGQIRLSQRSGSRHGQGHDGGV